MIIRENLNLSGISFRTDASKGGAKKVGDFIPFKDLEIGNADYQGNPYVALYIGSKKIGSFGRVIQCWGTEHRTPFTDIFQDPKGDSDEERAQWCINTFKSLTEEVVTTGTGMNKKESPKYLGIEVVEVYEDSFKNLCALWDLVEA